MKRMVGNILEMVGNHETDGWKYFETAGGGRKSLEAVQNPWRRPIYSGGGPKSLEAAQNPWRRLKTLDPFILLGVGLRWLAIISMVGFFQFCCFEIF